MLEHVSAAPVGDRSKTRLALAGVNLVSFVVATADRRQSIQNVRLTLTTLRPHVSAKITINEAAPRSMERG